MRRTSSRPAFSAILAGAETPSGPFVSRLTISPSTTIGTLAKAPARPADPESAAACRAVARNERRSSSPRSVQSARYPSHLISKSQSGSSNGSATSVASISDLGCGTGSRLTRCARRGAEAWRALGFDCHVLARGSFATSSSVFPLFTDSGWSAGSYFGSACSSRSLISSHGIAAFVFARLES